MTDSTAACVRGCSLYKRHLADCENTEECRGCLPRRAEHGHLCWPCHRRLELMFTDAPVVDRWLTGNMAAGDGAARMKEDHEQRNTTDGSPAPLKVQVYDQRQVLRDFYASTVDELCEAETLTGPDRHGVEADAAMLLTWMNRVEYWAHIGDLWEYLAEEVSIAHALAPWRPEMRRVSGVPCPEENCGEVNLVIYGGESDVTCLSCRHIIPARLFGLWEEIVKEGGKVA